MTKDPIFGMTDCWGCGEPTVLKGGNYTVACPGCDPETPICEMVSDIDTQELLHPELREYASMDEAVIKEALARR